MDLYIEGQAAALPCKLVRPLFSTRIPAGFPSPADDSIDQQIDLNTHFIQHPAATFFLRVGGDSMTGAGIYPGDLLIVDRSLEPVDGKIIVAVLDGEITLKRLRYFSGRVSLVPENPIYKPLQIRDGMSFSTWGVVTAVIHQV